MSLFQTIWNVLNSKIFVFVSFFVMLFLLAKTSNNYFNWTDQKDSGTRSYIIYSDGAAYYNYLPQWFIYGAGDLKFLEEIKLQYPKARFGNNLGFDERLNKKTNKYYPGTAVAISPFFLIAHSIETLQNGKNDGYSDTYLLFVCIAAVFYWLVGALAIYLLLLRLKIPRFYAVITLFAISFGTNLSYYVVYAPSYAHVYSFACVAWILYITERWIATNKNNYFYLLGLLLGLAFIIRPTNIIIALFIPFFFENHRMFFLKIKLLLTKNILVLLIFLIFSCLPLMFHFWNTYLQIGEFKLNTYSDEGFDFLLSPHIFEVLFGIRTGIFFYAPVLLLSIFGLIYLYKLKRHLFWGFLLVFCFFTYITASWWCWWYGGGFSMRPFVDIIAIFVITLAFLLINSNKVLKLVCIVLVFLCTGLTQIYSYQVSRSILHYDNITAKHFSEVFLQTDKRFRWHPFLSHDKIPKKYSIIERSVKFKNYNLPVIAIESNSEDNFAGRIKGSFKIENPDQNPFYHITYYSNDTIVEENIYFGSKIPKLKEFQYVTLDIYPGIKTRNLDSISIILYASLNEIYYKDIYLDLLKEKD